MKIKQLHYFMAIAEYLNYRTASDAADVSPSLLSQQMVSLEEELGVPLFTRNKKSVALTPAGEELKRAFPELEKTLKETMGILHRMQESRVEVYALHVGYENFFVRNIILAFDGLLKERHPDIQGIYKQYTLKELFRELESGRIDLAFAVLPSDLVTDEMQVRLIREEELVMVVHKKLYERYCRQDIWQIAKYKPLCGYVYNLFGTDIIKDLHKQSGIRPKLKLCEDIDEMLTYVESGMGYTILPRIYIESRRNEGLATICELPDVEGKKLCLTLVHRNDFFAKSMPELEEIVRRIAPGRPKCSSCNIRYCALH